MAYASGSGLRDDDSQCVTGCNQRVGVVPSMKGHWVTKDYNKVMFRVHLANQIKAWLLLCFAPW